jgi:hypothetical protein
MLDPLPKCHDLLRMKLDLLGSFTRQTEVHPVPAIRGEERSHTSTRLIREHYSPWHAGETNRSED